MKTCLLFVVLLCVSFAVLEVRHVQVTIDSGTFPGIEIDFSKAEIAFPKEEVAMGQPLAEPVVARASNAQEGLVASRELQ